MKRRSLRCIPRISYSEVEEPNLDEYVFCEKCADFVYEYCSIHGPLLVIPDDKVPTLTTFPDFIPRAALTIPRVFLHIAPSIIPGAGLGVFSTMTLPRGVRFGPYCGRETKEIESSYCWQIRDSNNKRSHVIDASDANASNWMRYVNCARHWYEQNLVAYQYQGQIYYRTIKIIPRFTELMVFYGGEFAASLHIDLRTYNSPSGYAQKFGAPTTKKRKLEQTAKSSETPKNESTNGQGDNGNNSTKNISKANEDLNRNMKIKNFDKEKKNNELNEKLDRFKNDVKKSDKMPSSKSTQKPKETRKNCKTTILCDMCGLIFKCKDSLALHIVKTHETFEPKNTTNITHTDVNKENLDQKETKQCNSNVAKKPYSCTSCQKSFARKDTLNLHLRIHTGEKPFSCTYCQYETAFKNALILHIRTHTGEKPFSCNYCHYKTAVKSALIRHIRTHTGEKPFSCNYCHYKTVQKAHLTTHIRRHTGEKPFSCNYCHYKTAYKNVLVDHIIRIHTGEKPFSCNYCHYKTAYKNVLVDHIRTHTGEKPFSCTYNYCHYKTTQKSNLIKHERTHTGEKPI